MQYGAFFPSRDIEPDPGAVRAWAEAAEGLGFDYIDVSDHVLGARRDDWRGPYTWEDAFHETFVTLGFIAAVTERVGLASAVLILPQRATALVAKQAAEVDLLSGGRLRLGVGVGWNRVELEALNREWATRGVRQAEQIELMNRLWTDPLPEFEGRWESVRGAGLNPLPVQRPIPVWFGGSAPAMLERAARLGQGWIPLGRPDGAAVARREALFGHLRAAGRDPAHFGTECWIRANGGPGDWRAEADAWAAYGATHTTFYASGLGTPGVEGKIEMMRRFLEAMA